MTEKQQDIWLIKLPFGICTVLCIIGIVTFNLRFIYPLAIYIVAFGLWKSREEC